MREILYRVKARDTKVYRTRNGAGAKVAYNKHKSPTVHVAVVEWQEVQWPIPEEVMDELYNELEQ